MLILEQLIELDAGAMLYVVATLSLLLALTCVMAYPRSLRHTSAIKRGCSRRSAHAYSGNNDFGEVVMVEGPVLKVSICVCVCVCVYIYMCVCVRVYIYACVCTCRCVFLFNLANPILRMLTLIHTLSHHTHIIHTIQVRDPNTNTRVTLVGVSHGSPASAGE